jgi:hypothetical protein
MSRYLKLAATAVALTLTNPGALAATATFEELVVPSGGFFSPGADASFESGGATFIHTSSFPPFFSGFSYSNSTDSTTPEFGNQNSAVPGEGANGSDQYAFAFGQGARIEFENPSVVNGGFFTNTTYAFLAMRDGDDGVTPSFVKGPFGEDDVFNLKIAGVDSNGTVAGTVTFSLASGSDVVDAWTFVDLISLGAVDALVFSFEGSDVGNFGIDTPTYFPSMT